MIIGLVVGLVLVAVPLYLWRRPEQATPDELADMPGAGGAAAAVDGAVPYVPLVDAAVEPTVKLSSFDTIWCKDPGPGKTPASRCDHVDFFEDALARAIQDNALCAPSEKTGATISFVLEINFARKSWRLSRGKSSTLSEAKVKELFRCVKKGMPTPDWGSIPHQHSRYLVAVKATYPPSETF
jgi:hypothetical protein